MTWRPAITQLYAILGAVFAVPIAALGIWQSRALATERAEEWDRQLVARAHDVAEDVSQLLQLRLEEVERMAARAERLTRWGDSDKLRGIFDDRSSSAGFVLVSLNDRWGTSLVSSPERDAHGEPQAGINYADRPYYQQLVASRKPVISDGTLGRRTHQPIISMVAPVLGEDGALRGFVTGALHLGPLQERVNGNAAAGQAHIVLTDASGAVLADSAGRLAVLSPYPLPLQPSADLHAAHDLSTAHAPHAAHTPHAPHNAPQSMYDPVAAEQVRRAAMEVSTGARPWRVHVSIPEAQIVARIDQINGDTLLATGATMLFCLSVVYLLALATRRDIMHFSSLQKSIGRGDFRHPGSPISRVLPREAHEIWIDMAATLNQLDADRATRLRLIDELQHANEHARSLAAGLRDAHDGFVVLDRERRIVYVNPAWLRLRDLRREQVLGKKSLELDPEQGVSAAHILAIDEALRNNKPWSGTVSFRHRDGSAREADLSISPVFDDHCEVEHYVELVRDVTARREAEAAMQQSERLASLGMLAAGVAHEINNPMTYVLGNLEHLSELAQDGVLHAEPAAEVDLALCLADCTHGARRVIEIVSDLRALSQQRQDEKAVASALQTIEICLRMAQSQIRHRAEVVRRFPTEDLWLGINSQRLSQVVLNLLLNGVQAMSASHATHNKLTVAVRRRSDGRGEISVSDTGTGMSLEVAQRIFDPFFTTKGTGVGTGLGLSICHSIVTGAHGEILVESELGKGTCFRIILPLAQLAEETAATQLASLRGLSVLVVDDEPGVLTAIRRMLATCRTSTASSVKQALEMIEHDHYDLVLSDVMMAEVNGVELVHALRARAPALARRVCLMSGGLIGTDLEQAVKTIGVPLLHKPLTRVELHQALWEVHRAAA